MSPQSDGKVVVFAPYAKDAESVARVLTPHGMVAQAVTNLADLVAALGDDVGTIIMSEEALFQRDWSPLVEAISAQPAWSSYPFVLLVGQRSASNRPEKIYSLLPNEVSNVVLLERPMGSTTLVSAVRSALAGRRRQFVTRDHLRELEENARQQALLTRELAHRVKNTIAVLQSIVTQTMRPYPETANLKTLIVDRFAALSRAHDLLLGTDFAAADFRELVACSTGAHTGTFSLAGPSIELSPQTSLSFALVLHELATNAVKYGALRAANGSVEVAWRLVGSRFELDWLERNGPPVNPPEKSGFGSRLITSTLEGLGELEVAYPTAGFELHFRGDIDRLAHGVVDG